MIYSKFFTQRQKSTKVMAAMLIVFTIMFMGCSFDEKPRVNTGFVPVGEWFFGEAPFIEGYNITDSVIEYYSPDYGPDYPGQNLKGNIEEAVDFSDNAGVLIIKITSVDNMELTPGKYTCVYYKDYKSSNILLANPVDSSWNPIETDNLNEAKKLFTVDNVSTHVSYWGSGYTK